MGQHCRSSRGPFLTCATLANAIVFLLLSFFTVTCQGTGSRVPDTFQRVVEQVKARYAPDARVERFQIELARSGKSIIARGEVTAPHLRRVLLDSLTAQAGSYEIVDSIQVLPLPELGPRTYGIVRISVATQRATPTVTAEIVNQALLGTVVRLYRHERGYFYIRNWDRYLGWLSTSSVVVVDSAEAARWERGPRVIGTANYGVVRERARTDASVLVDLVPGVVMKQLGQSGNWVQVELPDGRVGYVDRQAVTDEDTFREIPPSRERLVAVARSYLGIPYLWGAASTKAFDCSGFTQTVYRMNNVPLPRDASQQVFAGEPVDPGREFENLKAGDLLFFGRTPERITHVAMYLGDRLYIHSAGLVHINSLDPEHPLFNEHRYDTLQNIKRILPE
jgi:cell wall-associated NlpC family hydrolase